MPRIEARHLEPGMLASLCDDTPEPAVYRLVDRNDWIWCYGTQMNRIRWADGEFDKVPAVCLFDVLDDALKERAS